MRNRNEHEIIYKQLMNELNLKDDNSLTALELQIYSMTDRELLEKINIGLVKLNLIALKENEIFKLINY